MTVEAGAEVTVEAGAELGAGLIGVAPGESRDMLDGVQTQSLSPVFIGRDAELTRLASALAAADGGEPQAVLIGGEAGVGKTRLTEELLARARAAGAVTAVGACVEIGADGLPFAPVSTALRDLYGTLGAELLTAAAGQEAELARLLPELGDSGGGPRDPHDEDGRVRLFELTARLLERLGTDRTLVLVVEDLHWADRSTRELLAYLFRSLQRARLVIAATYRADDIHRRHPLRPFLAETDRLRTVERIELPRFSHAEVRRQLASILGVEPEDAVVDQVFARSDGNPFFVEELACGIRVGCVTPGLSESLRDLLLVRVEALSEDAQRVAKFVAEGGNTVEYRLLEAICGLGEDQLIDALRTAVGAHMLLPSESGDGYRFRHSLVREAVGDDLLPGERSRINRRYAEAIEADPTLVRAHERAARLASYWYAAHDPAKALPAVLRASVEARHRHAYAEQYRLLERALELWDDAPEAVRWELRPVDYAEAYPACEDCDGNTPLSFLDLLAEITVAARLGGERERAYAMAKRALRLMERGGGPDPLRAAWFWAQRSRLTEDLGRGDGWEELSRARELVRGLQASAAHAEVMGMIAGWIMVHKSGAEGIAIASRAVELARLAGARDTELHARVTLGLLQADCGDIEGGIAEVEEVRRLVSDNPAPGIVARTYGNLSSVLEGAGRSREAIRLSREAQALIGDQMVHATRSWLLVNEGESLMALGRYAEAAVALEQAHRVVERPFRQAGIELHQGLLALVVGDTDGAARYFAIAADGLRHDTQPQHRIPMRLLALELAVAQGRFDEARRELLAAMDVGFPMGTQRYAWPLLAAGVAAEADGPWLATGDAGRERVLDRVRAAARELLRPGTLAEAYALQVDAELARAEGRVEPALWAAAVEAWERVERPA
ncbi:MAG: hypothetical protein QOF98_891, partial [Streptomyces sp.]|nr:hypothetical protein [Streptomyces sp.]